MQGKGVIFFFFHRPIGASLALKGFLASTIIERFFCRCFLQENYFQNFLSLHFTLYSLHWQFLFYLGVPSDVIERAMNVLEDLNLKRRANRFNSQKLLAKDQQYKVTSCIIYLSWLHVTHGGYILYHYMDKRRKKFIFHFSFM